MISVHVCGAVYTWTLAAGATSAGTSAVVGFNGRLIPTWGHSGAMPKNTTDLSQGADEIWELGCYFILLIGRGREVPSS